MIESTHNIFMFWNSGFDESPELIRACANSWKHHHEGTPWKIHLLDEKNVFQYMAQMQTEDSEALKHQLGRIKRKERCGDIVKFTDLLRLALLDNFGGVWADATVFCQKPLDAWIDNHQKSLLAPKSHEANRRHEAWFLINLHQSAYLSDWKNAFRRHIISGVDFCDDWKFSADKHLLLDVATWKSESSNGGTYLEFLVCSADHEEATVLLHQLLRRACAVKKAPTLS